MGVMFVFFKQPILYIGRSHVFVNSSDLKYNLAKILNGDEATGNYLGDLVVFAGRRKLISYLPGVRENWNGASCEIHGVNYGTKFFNFCVSNSSDGCT